MKILTQSTRRYLAASAAALGLVAVLWLAQSQTVEAQPGTPVASGTSSGPLPLGAMAQAVPARSAATVVPASAPPVEVRGLPDFTVLVDLVGPAVVNIRTVERVRRGGSPEDQMQEFFRRFGIPLPPGMSPRGPQGPQEGPEIERPRGVGSGFILTPDGFILTNAHVVEGASEVVVTLNDEREFTARVVGSDRRTDVAVVKIEATRLPTVRIGDVNRLRVGEWVMAIGSPFGLENTVTAGIVSAKQRETGEFLPFIQTDVAINPGNSGGPLINMRGEVVGINSMIYSRSGGFQGISFAIPIDEAMVVADQLRATGRVTRGRIGVAIAAVDRETAETMRLPRATGALIRGVENNSPAARGGIEPGDVILSFDGKAVERSTDLPRIVAGTAPGSRVPVRVWRQGAERTLTVTVAAFEDERTARAGERDAEPPAATPAAQRLGLHLREPTAAERRSLRIEGGVWVAAASGAAARAGLLADDVILAIGNRPVASVREFEAAAAAVPQNRPVHVLVRRGDWTQYAIIRP